MLKHKQLETISKSINYRSYRFLQIFINFSKGNKIDSFGLTNSFLFDKNVMV